MAEYNVDILVKAKIQQAERALDALKKKIDSISKNPVIKVGARGIQDLKTYSGALKDLGLKGAAVRGGLAAVTLQLGKFGGVTKAATGFAATLTSGLGGLVAKTTAVAAGWGTLGTAIAASGQAFNLTTKATAGVEQVLGQVLATLGQLPATWGAAAIAALAFAPQVAKAGTALNNAVGEKATKSIAATVQQFNNLNEQVKFTATSFQDLIKGSTLNQLNAQLQDANRQIGAYRSNTEEARVSAQQLLAVTKAQAAEQRAINDLVRQTRGITQTELEESKAIKTLETKRRKQAYLTEEANKYNLEIDEYNRLAREAAEVTKKWEQSLRAANTAAKAGVLGSTNQIRARLQEMRENRQSAEIARQRSAVLMGTSGAMQGPGALGDVARAEANRVALRAQAVKLLEQERQKAQQNIQLMQNWTNVLRQGPVILTDMQRLRAKELQDRKDAFVVANRELQLEIKLRNLQEGRTARAGLRKSAQGRLSSAAIGGAFPLLFGQSGLAAAGGAIGGLLGGAGGGFAGSLVGTLIGDLINVKNGIKELAREMGLGAEGTKLLGQAFRQAGADADKFQAAVQNIRGVGFVDRDELTVIQLASRLTEDYGGKVDRLSQAYANIASTGKSSLADINKFTAQGVPILKQLEKNLGVNRQELLKLAKDGKISAQQVSDALIDIANAGRDSSLETEDAWYDSWKSIKDSANKSLNAIKVILRPFVSDIKKVALKIMEYFAEVYKFVVEGAVKAATGMTRAFAGGFEGLADKLTELDKLPGVRQFLGGDGLLQDAKRLRAAAKDFRGSADELEGVLKTPELEPLAKPTLPGLQELSRDKTTTKKGRESQLAQLQNAYILLVEQTAVQNELYAAQLKGNEVAAVQLNKKLKLLEISKQERDVNLERIPAQEKAVKLQTLQVEKYRAELEALYQISVIEQKINDARDAALGDSNARINQLQAEIQGRGRDYELTQRIQELEKAGVENAADQANAEFQLLDIKNQQIEAQQQLNSLVNQLGTSTTKVFEDLIFATDSWRQSLANALQTMASALFRFGLNTLADAGDPAGQGVGLFSILAGRFGKRANGGPVTSGSPYLVGERGPELFVPGASGNIVPNNAMGGSNIVVNVDATGSSVQGNGDESKRLGEAIGIAIRQELIKQKRPGGLLA